MLNISQLSTKYRIKKMEEEDISGILNLENGNPQYFAYCPPKPCRETVLNDLKAIPEGKSEDKISEEIEDSHEEVELSLDIDKMWDVLHFMLTGGRRLEPIKNEPLSEAVVGEFSIDDAAEFMAYTEKSKIKNIVFALDHFDMKKALEKFSMEECKTADLYPNIWDDEEEIDEIKEEIMDCFQCMKEFYHHILEANGNILITIC